MINDSGKKDKKILIAEDEVAYSRSLKFKLEREGYDVTDVINGELALDKLKKDSFDLLIIDLIMPKVNGFEVLEELKNLNIKLPIIVLSNLNQEEDRKRVSDSGSVMFLDKSDISVVDVINNVKDILKKL